VGRSAGASGRGRGMDGHGGVLAFVYIYYLWDDVGNVGARVQESRMMEGHVDVVGLGWAGLIWAAGKGSREGDWAAPRKISSQIGHWIP
jgi:hypothetical protein